jgi:hypothetical protein
VPEHDLDMDHDTLDHLRDEGLVETVDLGDDERGVVLSKEGRDLLDSHTLEREDGRQQAFYAGASRLREIDHDANLYATYRQKEARLRDENGGLNIRRVVLEQDLKREYQEFLQARARGPALCRRGLLRAHGDAANHQRSRVDGRMVAGGAVPRAHRCRGWPSAWSPRSAQRPV